MSTPSSPLHLDPTETALLVMDYQHFILQNNVAAERHAEVIGRTAQLLAAARAAKMPVVYVMVGFRPGHPEVSARNRIFSAIKANGVLVLDQPATAIHPDVAPQDDEAVVVKKRIGAFSGTDMQTLLRSANIDTLVLAGVTTSGVVLSTTRQAFDLDYRVVIARDCCPDPDGEVEAVLLDKVLARNADIVRSQDVLTALSA
ncbi:cysteine hydrolase [Pandoraea sputorum]|uniref:cysteine hydrolase family protein n=1 Tax=Pandoraea sputorum TaxID=93222 RepID=UPI001E3D3EE5|nr:isochorismatase family cysteine hydrolase [Pandoraea sputorum]MCE4061072.1 cysteine hydrolase [Pandoraea sputorum]